MSEPSPLTPLAIFAAMEERVTPELASRIDALYLFEIDGDDGGLWRVDLTRRAPPFVEAISAPVPNDCTIAVTSARAWSLIATGRMNLTLAYLNRTLRIRGSLKLALAIGALIGTSGRP